jgi:hypothetical protein
MKPQFVFLENVPAIAVRGLDAVTSELVRAGYDCRWTMLAAAEVGAPHLRMRWFLWGKRRDCKNLNFLQESWDESLPEFKVGASDVGRLVDAKWESNQMFLVGDNVLGEFPRCGMAIGEYLYSFDRWVPDGGPDDVWVGTPTTASSGRSEEFAEGCLPTPEELAKWPTPRANDSEKRGDFDVNNPRNGLPAAAKRWPTPKACNEGTSEKTLQMVREGTAEASLARVVMMPDMWPTPGAGDDRGGRSRESWGKHAEQCKDRGINKQAMLRDIVLWPTPDVRGFTNDGSLEKMGKLIDDGTLTRDEASGMAYRAGATKKDKLWATPCAMDSLPPKSDQALNRVMDEIRPGRTTAPSLKDDRRLLGAGDPLQQGTVWSQTDGEAKPQQKWPTPTATERSGINPNTGKGEGLSKTVQMQEQQKWPTPRASEHKGCGPQGSKSQQYRLEKGYLDATVIEREKWPTPTAQDSENNAGPSQFDRNSLPLNAAVKMQEGEVAGTDEPPQTESGGQLAPNFVCWLMGYRKGWTALDEDTGLPHYGPETWQEEWPDTPRVIPTKLAPFRRSRLMALGNSVCPLQVRMAFLYLAGGIR